MKLTVINGNRVQTEESRQSRKSKRLEAFERGYIKSLDDVAYYAGRDAEPPKELLKRVIFYGARRMNHLDLDVLNEKQLKTEVTNIDIIRLVIGLLTPNEFMTIFPIDKEYKGGKWGSKDYFYTMEKLAELNLDEHIAQQIEVNEFLWHYWNQKDIMELECNMLAIVSKIRRLQGRPGLAEEYFKGQGVDMYTQAVNTKGEDVLINSRTGDEIKVVPKTPRYLKLVH